MLWGGVADGGGLELRRAPDGGVRLRGSFPYNSPAILSDGGRSGRPRKELFEPGAFAYSVNDERAEINLLVGHSFDKPLASKLGGSLLLNDTDTALTFTAMISAAVAETTHGKDALALIGAGLAVGVSPGFRIPPERAVPRDQAEVIEEEPDDGQPGIDGQPQRGAIIRRIRQAILRELSIVTVPAYPDAQVEARRWSPETCERAQVHPLKRWRA